MRPWAARRHYLNFHGRRVHRLKRVIAGRGHSCGWGDDGSRAPRWDAAMPGAAGHPATYRYAAVGALAAVLVFFLIVAPSEDWSRAVALLLEGAALVVALATSRERAG